MKKLSLAILLLPLAAAGCIQSNQYWWHEHMLVWHAATKEECIKLHGAPNYDMSIEQFVNCLDDSPHDYRENDVFGNIIYHSYRDFVRHEIWVDMHLDLIEVYRINASADSTPKYDPDYIQKPPYNRYEFWVYDESKRYKKPVPGTDFTCMIILWNHGKPLGIIDLSDHWDFRKAKFPESLAFKGN